MGSPERAVVALVRRVAAKERRLDKMLRETAGLRRDRARATRAERNMRVAVIELREYLLARGRQATFVDVLEGLDLVLDGRRMPAYWHLAIDNARRHGRSRIAEVVPVAE